MPDQYRSFHSDNEKESFKKMIEGSFLHRTMMPSMGPEQFEKPKPYVKKDEKLVELTERVEALERLIKLTFNGHVLIDGQFRKIIP